jgi:hypothetical protein
MSKRNIDQKSTSFQEFNRLNNFADRIVWGFGIFVLLGLALTVYIFTT